MATKKSAKKKAAAKKPAAKPSAAKKSAPPVKAAVKKPAAVARPGSGKAAIPPARKSSPTASKPPAAKSAEKQLPKKLSSKPIPEELDLSSPLLRSLQRIACSENHNRGQSVFAAARAHLPLQALLLVRGSGRDRRIFASLDSAGFTLLDAQRMTEENRLIAEQELPERPEAVREIPFRAGPQDEARGSRGVAVPFTLGITGEEPWHALWIFEPSAPAPARRQADMASLFLPALFPLLDAALAEQELETQIKDAEDAGRNAFTELQSRHEQVASENRELQSRLDQLLSDLAEEQKARTVALQEKESADEALRVARADRAEESQKIRDEYDQKIKELQNSIEVERAQVRAEHEQKILALKEEESRNIKRLAEAHGDEREAALARLKEELDLEVQLRDEEIAKIREALAEEKRQTADTLASRAEAHKGEMLKAEQKHQSEMERVKAALEKEHAASLQTARSEAEKVAREHANEKKQAEERFAQEKKDLLARISTLEKSHGDALTRTREEADRKYSDLESRQRQAELARDEEKRKTEEGHRSLVEGLQTEIRNRDDQIREQKENAFKLQESLEKTLGALEQEREAHAKTVDHLNERIARIEEESVLVAEDLNRTIKEGEKSIQQLEQTAAILREKEKTLTESLSEAHKRVESLDTESRNRQSQVHELTARIETERKEYQTTLNQLKQEAEAKLLAARKDVEEVRVLLSQRESELKSRAESQHRTEQQLAHATQKIGNLNNELEASRTNVIELTERIQEIERSVEKTFVENRELQELMRVKNEEIRTKHMEEQKLKRSLQASETRAAELEGLVEQEKGRVRERDETLHRRGDEITALTGKIESLGKDIENYLAVLQQRKEAIDALRVDLEAARVQIKNSRQEGSLLIEASRALSQMESFGEKIDYLRERVLRNIPISRLVFYSMDEEGELIPTFSRPSFAFASAHLRLTDTFFGQALASQKPVLMKKRPGEDPYDLPPPNRLRFTDEDRNAWEEFQSAYDAAKKRSESSIILPLVLGSRTEGILVLGSETPLDERKTDMGMLEHLAPFVATAYHEEKSRVRVQELSSATAHLRTVKEFVEIRSNQIQLLARDSLQGEEQKSLEMKTRYISPLLELAGSKGTFDTVQAFIENIAASLKNSSIYTEFRIDDGELRRLIPGDSQDLLLLLWLIGEAVANMLEHSEAHRLLIETRTSNEIPGLIIEDDGEGLVRKTGSMEPRSGRGFAAMKALASLLGLSFRVRKGEGGLGTSIRLYRM